MKTEDIDKRIGMPDVDKEWARFEQEVISGGTKRHSALAWALGIGIAASVALLIIYNIGKEQTEEPLVAQVQPARPEHVSELARVPAKEVVAEVSKPVATPRKELALIFLPVNIQVQFRNSRWTTSKISPSSLLTRLFKGRLQNGTLLRQT